MSHSTCDPGSGSGDVPDYLDPLDGLGWRQAILDYAAAGSARRLAQLERLASWTPPSWDRHVSAAVGFARNIVGGQSQRD